MRSAQQLFGDYVVEHRAGGEANPQTFLARAAAEQRDKLAELIDGYLSRAPRQAFDAERFAQSSAAQVVADLEAVLIAAAETWPVLLPKLRESSELRRSELVDRLADGLGVSAQREKVAVYYHQMEQGQIPPAGVADRVLDVLGGLLGATRQALRAAGAASGPHAEGFGGAATFARTAASSEPATANDAEVAADTVPTDWDEVDELFLGG